MTRALASSSWTAQALAVLERACDHYGGLETWRALRQIRLLPDRLSGLVPWSKGNGRTFPLPTAFEIRPHERWVRFVNFPDANHVGVFENGAVRLERGDGGEIVVKAEDHRRSFRGFAMNRRWSPLDALYFFGYALTHYHSLPFSLFDARLIGTREAGSRSERLDVLAVELPADLPTHCRRQSFYFDNTGRLTRHDYHAEIWASGLAARIFGTGRCASTAFPSRSIDTSWPGWGPAFCRLPRSTQRSSMRRSNQDKGEVVKEYK